MKKIFTVLLLFVLAVSTVTFVSCAQTVDLFEQYKKEEGFSYYRQMTMNTEKKLYVFNKSENLSSSQKIAAEAIQGIYARTNAKFYYWRSGNYEIWLQDLVENYGFTTQDVSFAEMMQMFANDYGAKYVLYDGTNNPESLNCACTVSGALDYIPVDKSLEEQAKQLGFQQAADVSQMTEGECFERYKEFLNNDGLVQINYENFNDQMRDYGIACKYLFLWPKDMNDSSVVKFRAEALSWVEDDSPIFGWVPNDETTDVAIASNYGLFTLASDYCTNMSIFACKNVFDDLEFNQSNKVSDIKAQQGKHYVCIMMSDGDNVQTWYNTFPTSEKYLGAERGDFAMGWSIQPSLYHLAPNILNYVYSRADKNDYFVCSVSGQGYINPQVYPDLADFIGGLDAYLQYTDLSVVQILDSGPSDEVMEMYSLVPHMKGAIYCYGEKYAGGAGSVYWKNGKPFVAIRETLWNADVESMAKRINGYSTDPTSIDGYTAINLHPWSMTYNDVKKLVSLLDDDVVVVTADDFIRLITENVPQVDVTKTYTSWD